MKNHRWLDLTEYALMLGSGAGTVASVATQQAFLATAPLSLLMALGLINRRRLQTHLTQSQSVALAINTNKFDKRLQDVQGRIEDLPTHGHLRAVRRSVIAQSHRDILSLSQVLEHTRQTLKSQIDRQEILELKEQQQLVVRLQEQYTQLYIDFKDVAARCQQLSNMGRVEATETMVARLKAELMQLRVHLDILGADAKNNYAGLNDKIHYLQQQVQQLTADERQSLLREEVQELVKAISGMVFRDEFSELSSRFGTSIEQLQQRLDAVDQRLNLAADAPGQPEALSASAGDNPWLLDFVTAEGISPSRHALNQLLAQAQERLVLVWPWADGIELDDELLQQFRQLLGRGCRLDIGWCHQGDNREPVLLRSIGLRWREDSARHRQLKQAFRQLLPLKQDYPDLFSFKVLGTTENFAVCDSTCALVGMQALSTQTSLFPTVAPKLRISDPSVIQPLIERFENPIIEVTNAGAYFNRGRTRYDTRDFAGAIDDFTQVIAMGPSAAAYNCRGVAWLDRGNRDKALQDFSHGIRLDASLFAPHCNRGVLRLDRRDYAGALNDLEAATDLCPQSAIPYFYQAQALQALGNLRHAIQQFTLAIERRSDLALPYCYRSVAYQKQGSLHRAIADLEIAARLLRTRGDMNNLEQVTRKLETLKQGPPAIRVVEGARRLGPSRP
ncbi:MAG: tetratricopeptide repeat protein [Cyanobacteria bacterium P01_D01_bin.2]